MVSVDLEQAVSWVLFGVGALLASLSAVAIPLLAVTAPWMVLLQVTVMLLGLAVVQLFAPFPRLERWLRFSSRQYLLASLGLMLVFGLVELVRIGADWTVLLPMLGFAVGSWIFVLARRLGTDRRP